MAEIVEFPRDERPDIEDPEPLDAFLLDEGLELLADFRAIADRDLRASLRSLVKMLARKSRL